MKKANKTQDKRDDEQPKEGKQEDVTLHHQLRETQHQERESSRGNLRKTRDKTWLSGHDRQPRERPCESRGTAMDGVFTVFELDYCFFSRNQMV